MSRSGAQQVATPGSPLPARPKEQGEPRVASCFAPGLCVPHPAPAPSRPLQSKTMPSPSYIPNAKSNSWLRNSLQPEKLKAPHSPPPQEEPFASIRPEASASSAFSHSTSELWEQTFLAARSTGLLLLQQARQKLITAP